MAAAAPAVFIDSEEGPEFEDVSVLMSTYNFESKQVIGKGTYGQVYVLQNLKTKQAVAMKVMDLHSGLHKYLTHHAMKDIYQTGYMSNRFIINMYDIFQSNRTFYFIMELAPNRDIFYWMYSSDKGVGAFAIDTVRCFSAELVKALEYLRTQRLVHRDIKADNVLLSKDFHIKLSDFGTAKNILEDHGKNIFLRNKEKQSRRGTMPHYAPEVWFEKEMTFSTDLWSLGLLMFEMYCGYQIEPFDFYSQEWYQVSETERHQWAMYHYTNIGMDEGYEFPYTNPDPGVKDLVKSLTSREAEKRIGHADLYDLKEHDFFRNIDWANIEKMKSPGIVKNTEAKPIKVAASKAGDAAKKSFFSKLLSAKESVKHRAEDAMHRAEASVKSKVESAKAGVEKAAQRAEDAMHRAEEAVVKKFFKGQLEALKSPPPEAKDEESDSEDEEVYGLAGHFVIKNRRPRKPRYDPARPPWESVSPVKKPDCLLPGKEPVVKYGRENLDISGIEKFRRVGRWSTTCSKLISEYNYENKELIQAGTFQKFYKIQHRTSGVFYQMRVLDKYFSDMLYQRIKRERLVLKLVNFSTNPYFYKILKELEDDDRLFILSEYIPNGDLYNAIHNRTNSLGFEISCVRFYAAELVSALDFLRRMQYIHRDLTVETISFDKNWHLKITDVWAARKFIMPQDNDLEMWRDWIGFNQKALNVRNKDSEPPEVAHRRFLQDCKVPYGIDLWDLGLLVFEMYTGQAPLWFKEFLSVKCDPKTADKFHETYKKDSLYMDEDDKKFLKQFLDKMYEFIEEQRYEYAILTPDPHLKDLVHKLTALDAKKRLGAANIQELKTHPFFTGTDWENLYQTKPPSIEVNEEQRKRQLDSETRTRRKGKACHGQIFTDIDVMDLKAVEAALNVTPQRRGDD